MLEVLPLPSHSQTFLCRFAMMSVYIVAIVTMGVVGVVAIVALAVLGLAYLTKHAPPAVKAKPVLVFRGDKKTTTTDTLVAKGGLDGWEYSIEEHVATNPRDSNWISLTSSFAVAFWFAVSRKSVGDRVYISMYDSTNLLMFKTKDFVSSSIGVYYATWAREFVINKTLPISAFMGVYEVLVTKDDLKWSGRNTSNKKPLWLIPHRQKSVAAFIAKHLKMR